MLESLCCLLLEAVAFFPLLLAAAPLRLWLAAKDSVPSLCRPLQSGAGLIVSAGAKTVRVGRKTVDGVIVFVCCIIYLIFLFFELPQKAARRADQAKNYAGRWVRRAVNFMLSPVSLRLVSTSTCTRRRHSANTRGTTTEIVEHGGGSNRAAASEGERTQAELSTMLAAAGEENEKLRALVNELSSTLSIQSVAISFAYNQDPVSRVQKVNEGEYLLTFSELVDEDQAPGSLDSEEFEWAGLKWQVHASPLKYTGVVITLYTTSDFRLPKAKKVHTSFDIVGLTVDGVISLRSGSPHPRFITVCDKDALVERLRERGGQLSIRLKMADLSGDSNRTATGGSSSPMSQGPPEMTMPGQSHSPSRTFSLSMTETTTEESLLHSGDWGTMSQT